MNVFEAAAEAWRTGREAAFCTVVSVGGCAPRHAGARMLVHADGEVVGTIGGGELEHRVTSVARSVITSGLPVRFQADLTRDLGMCCGGAVEVYVEPLEVRPSFVVFGAGHVARATVPVLQALDFGVTVVDPRDDLATPERFPGCRLEVPIEPRELAAAHPGGDSTWYLVVTHDHRLDQDLGEILLRKRCAWLGMIGSRAKISKFMVRWRAAGVDPALFRRLSAPVGLDLGAETPAEIAVAIAAEVVRVRRGVTRPPLPLSELPLKARGGAEVAVPPALERAQAPPSSDSPS